MELIYYQIRVPVDYLTPDLKLLISCIDIVVIRAVNHFTGNFDQPIKLEIFAAWPAADVGSMTFAEFMRMCG